jgi:prolipoprotein diacylglyceryltransferase
VVEIFRAKDDRFFGVLTVAQVISLALVAAGIWMMRRSETIRSEGTATA